MASIFGLFCFTGFAQDYYNNGVFILNEGNYGSSNASISFLSPSGTVSNDVFSTVNPGKNLGDVAQSMNFEGDYAYIVTNASSEINVVNRTTFVHVATITTDINNPRYIEFDNGNGYITNWGDPTVTTDDYIAVLDLSTNTVTSTIAVAEGPEGIVKKNNQLFVAHKGGYGHGHTVSVIDLSDYSVSEITVADVPTSIEVDSNYLYVLCGGKPAWTGDETIGKLYIIDLNNFSVMDVYDFATGEHPSNLQVVNGQAYYILNNNVYSFDFTTSLPTSAFIDTSVQSVQTAYGLYIIDNTIYLADALGYTGNGNVLTYDASGAYQNTYTAGPIPNSVYKFNMPLGAYPPAAGQTGSTAIGKDDTVFIGWATGASVTRGLINITDPDATYDGSSYATAGEAANAIGKATQSAIVSLGDRGEAILTFLGYQEAIVDGPGYDFAVFENGFSDTFLELAFVEVSSDGINYFRFPSHSQTQTVTQVGGFGAVNPTYIHNLAGKYRAGFGTPFDLADLANNPLLDKNNITHIKVIDAVGTINPTYASYDSYGNIVNEPFPTPFHTGGFDLDAIGVIHNQDSTLSVPNTEITELRIYPNPASDFFYIKGALGVMDVEIYSITGQLVRSFNQTSEKTIDVSSLNQGVYLVKMTSQNKNGLFKLVKQ